MSVATAFLSPWGIFVDCIGSVNLDSWHWSLPRWDLENMGRLASTSFALALICGLETMSVGKSLSAKVGQRFNANQELMALGIANLGACFGSGLVASTSPTRSVAGLKWGAATALCSLFGGIFCYLAATVVGPSMNYFPRPVLAVLIMIFGASLINEHVIRMVLRTTQTDAVVFFVTLAAGLLFPLDVAIYVGVITSVVLFLRKVASPEMMEYVFNDSGQLLQLPATHRRPIPEISIVHVEGNLFFGAADLFQDQIRRVCEDKNLKVVILKMRHAHNLDATGVMALEELVRFMRDNHRILLMSETCKEISRVLHSSGLFELIGRAHIFMDALDNPTLSTAQALKAAQKLLGPGAPEAKITILVDSARPLE
jgi:sulfate permease, SulP family